MRVEIAKGFTMIEVLVALLILSIGLLGMAGLQLVSLQNSGTSLTRSQATMLAYDLAERMRRNPDQVSYYINNLMGSETSPNCLKQDTGCSPSELAREDIVEWQSDLGAINGQAVIGQSNNEITLQISWNDSQYGSMGTAAQSYEMTFEL